MTALTGTWKTSTESSSIRTLHAIVLPFLRGVDDNVGADAELMMTGRYQLISISVHSVTVSRFPWHDDTQTWHLYGHLSHLVLRNKNIHHKQLMNVQHPIKTNSDMQLDDHHGWGEGQSSHRPLFQWYTVSNTSYNHIPLWSNMATW